MSSPIFPVAPIMLYNLQHIPESLLIVFLLIKQDTVMKSEYFCNRLLQKCFIWYLFSQTLPRNPILLSGMAILLWQIPSGEIKEFVQQAAT